MAKDYNLMPVIFIIIEQIVTPFYDKSSLSFNNHLLTQLGSLSINLQCHLLTKFGTFEFFCCFLLSYGKPEMFWDLRTSFDYLLSFKNFKIGAILSSKLKCMKNVPECSRMFQNVPECSRMFMKACRMFLNVHECMQIHAWACMQVHELACSSSYTLHKLECSYISLHAQLRKLACSYMSFHAGPWACMQFP